MKTTFYIRRNRLKELKSFIKKFTPSVRFEHNPIEIVGDQYFISLEMNSDDGNKLNELHNKWYDEDNKPVEKMSIWRELLFKRLLGK